MSKFTTLFPPQCASYEEIAFRLWHNFRWKGFIHPDLSYKYIDKATPTRQEVRGHLERQLEVAMAAGRKEPKLLKKAKTNFRKKCFQSLSQTTLDTMMKRHDLDVRLFGYERERDEVLGWVYDGKNNL